MHDIKGYTVLEELGRGSMGVVYRARDQGLDRVVALKVLHDRFVGSIEALKRFDREARLAASLSSHPNIVTVYSAGGDGGGYHIAMEYLDGGSISSLLLSCGAQEVRRTVETIAQVADALAEAHDRGIVHRDIKPNNILLDRSLCPKVGDFGLARLLEAESDLTADNVRVGTFRYMSPEQCAFEPATQRTDIYSLGVVFFEMLSGRHAFKASNPLALVHEIVKTPFPSILDVRPEVPCDLARVLEKMVAKDPYARYGSAREVSEDLRSWLRTGTVGATGFGIPPLPPIEAPPYSSADSEPIVDKLETPDVQAVNEFSGPDCIIHFVESDRAWAEWIERTLSDAGYAVELAIWDFQNSREALRRLSSATRRSSCLIAVVSPSYITALFGDRTWTQAYVDGVIKATAVRVRSCTVPANISLHTYVDVVSLDPEPARKALLDEVLQRRGTPRGVKVKVEARPFHSVSPTVLRHPIWNIPYARARYFAGRNALLQDLYTTLAHKGGIATLVPAEADGEGLGLTQLAVEYAYYNESQYSFVWWIRADKKMARRLDYARLAKEARLNDCDSRELGTLVAAVQAWLARNDGWLLVFDDAESYGDLAPYIVKKPGCHILINSSRAAWPVETNPIPVGPLSRAESVDLLFQETHERNEGAAAALADVLGDVPLALAMATAYMRAEKASLDDYVDRFLDLHKAFWGVENPPRDALTVVATAAGLGIERLVKESPEALDLLKACAYLAQCDIRLARLCSGARCFPKRLSKMLLNPAKLTAAIGSLKRLGLIAEEKDAFYMHRLTQKLIVNWLEQEWKQAANPGEQRLQHALKSSFGERSCRLTWVAATLKFTRETFPVEFKSRANFEEGARLLCHALTAIQHAERNHVDPKTTSAVWRDMGNVLCELGEYVRACGAVDRAIALHKQAYGDAHKGLPGLYMQLARIHWTRSDLRKAKAVLEQTLALSKSINGERHVDVALVLHDIGNVLTQMGDYASARQYYRHALEIDQKACGKNREAVARDLRSLGLVTQELGDFVGAHEYYAEALEIAERVHGPNHREVSAVVKNLAALMQRMGDPVKARTYYERAIAMDTELCGAAHPPLAQYYNNLGIISQELGDPKTALARYQQAHRINETAYGPRHPKTAINMVNIANVLRLQNNLPEAVSLCKRAVDILTETLGAKHHLTLTAVRNLEKIQRGG